MSIIERFKIGSQKRSPYIMVSDIDASSTNLNDVILQIRDGEHITQENSDVTIDLPKMNPN
ncbi:hypothetical protein Glove_28g12 [Diversispora epigaea]|uniref:Uncharacterized protein n=1 Tax=Diversispora epigaea TaxID=1348612 RepID=A0A397JIV8_9GLOM|nr:hypothetical protein Glove_28g12 [Diversispora epigaea]